MCLISSFEYNSTNFDLFQCFSEQNIFVKKFSRNIKANFFPSCANAGRVGYVGIQVLNKCIVLNRSKPLKVSDLYIAIPIKQISILIYGNYF